MKADILVINGGSSSIKFSMFEVGMPLKQIFQGSIDRIGSKDATLQIKGREWKEDFSKKVSLSDYKAALHVAIDWMEEQNISKSLIAIGHRIVHGGPKYSTALKITEEVLENLRSLTPFAPDHLPSEIVQIEAFRLKFPHLPQFACFDTAFHHDLPRVAKLLPIPRHYENQGVRRYGFHGLSYEFLMQELERIEGKEAAQGKVILAHLGSGASLAAVAFGKSIDTTMSFTPTAGVPMSTRSGDLDPGLFGYLASLQGMGDKEWSEMINRNSGLLGISEISSDMRDLLNVEKSDTRASEAISIFCYQVKKSIGAFVAALGGLDVLIFTGGIGENIPKVRSRICEGLGYLGIELEEEKNAKSEGLISIPHSKVTVRVIRAEEERMIAQTILRMVND